ncbi:zinc-binding alcohol dehydrogenase family protein [Duncaniella freteri]|jgi:threonine dehydrogenase-like Zn-dependent dehydrogenase|uniref:zinc-binding alcohol dehydrogenase family protein n=1 Tax=Duncaniella freteri TaxID=2530391 RepID=UPI0025568CAB|nr:zinc-binding alcohol dehydrogenase family protein [Duncaniella freteri]
MLSIQISSPGKVELVEQEKPILLSDQVLIRIHYVGFCGSDLNTYLGRNPLAISPVIPGHEIGGTVEAVGKDVPAGLFAEGMSVTVNPYTACGKCSSCRKGRPNACEHNQTLGVQRNGAMSDYIAVPWGKVIPAPGISPRDCALIEPMSVGFHAVDRGAVSDIDTVMVIGCGMIGLGAVVRASMRGATVIAVDLDDEKLDLAKRLGATHALNSKSANFHEELMALTGGCGPDVVVEAVGSPVTYVLAVDEVAFAGRVVCIGYAKSDVSFHTKLFVQKELDIRGSRNAMPSDFNAVIRYLSRGNCPMEELISRIIKPEEVSETLQYWSENPGKVFRILAKFD